MDAEIIVVLMFVSLFTLLILGLPLAFSLGGVSLLFSVFLWGPESLFLVVSRAIGVIHNYVLIAVPLFMFMASILQNSEIADDLFESIHIWMGPLRGGLAIGTILICTAMAAMSGVSAAAVLTMGTLALPAMLGRNYDKSIALGAITAGGALGQLIPPSLLMILYGAMAGVSVGKLFIGGILPGLLLAGLFIAYVLIRSFIQKDLCPALPLEKRQAISVVDVLVSIKAVILPVSLIVGVLGSIFAGIATPTEAAAVGAFGSIIIAALHRRLTWETFKLSCYNTLKSSCMVIWVIIGSLMFVSVYFAVGGSDLVKSLLIDTGLNRWIILIGMQILLFLLGCMMDTTGVVMLCTPLFVPIIKELGFDPLWFGVLFIVNLEMAYLTPPFGYNLFYLKSVAPPDVTMADIYMSVGPFICLQAAGLFLCMLFPEIITWLPAKIMG